MKPTFALNFTDDAIGLLHRTARGWLEIGSVPFDDKELAQAVAYLRGSALGLEPRGMTTKLIIPNSQIRYLSLPAPGPDAASRRAQIKAGLEGKTPYDVDDLVFDWSGTGPTVQVAVVARETLDEAEAFARDNRLNPVSFVAIPESGAFRGEPWFGPTALAATILAPGEKVERDQDPVRIVGPAARGEAAPAPEPAAKAEPPAPAATEAPAEAPPAPAPAAEPAVDATPETAAAAPTVTAPEDAAPAEAPAASAAPRMPAKSETAPTAPAPEAPPAAEVIGSRVTDASIPAETPAPPASGDVAPPAKAPAPSAPTAKTAASQPPEGGRPVPPVIAPPAAGKASRGTPPAKTPPPKVPDPRRTTGPRLTAVPGGGAPVAASSAARVPVPEAEWPLERVTAGARTGKADLSRSAPVVTAPSIPLPKGRKFTVVPASAPPTQPDAATPESRTEAEAMTVFGARKGREPGKPRYLLLILVAILVATLAAVALWSSLFLAQRDTSDGTEVAAVEAITAPAEPASTDPSTADPEAAADGIGAPDPLTLPEEPASDAATAAGAIPAEPAIEGTDPEAAADLAAAPEPEPEAAPQPEPAPFDSAAVASAGAEASGARNGGDDPQDEIFLSLADRPVATADAVALAPPTAATDAPPAPQPLPPPFGTLYQFDAQGRIVPTPEGIVTPEGVRLVAGKPPRVPPTRPETPAAADATATAAAEAAAEPVETAPVVGADPALAGARPRLRPADLVPPAAPETAGSQDDAGIASADDTRLSSLKPRARPADLFAEGEAALAAQTAAAQSSAASLVAGLDETGDGSPLALAVSRRPAARPAALNQSIEAAVQLAAAEASLATPTAPLLAPAEPASAPEPAPAPVAMKPAEPEPEPRARAEPERDPDAPGTSAFTKHSDDPALVEQDEPESGGSAPAASARSVVAKQATVANALNMSKTSLIGIYGSPSNRYAMVRQAGGRFVKVSVGDRIDGGRVAAISERELSYVKNGQTHTLKMPRT